MPEQVQLQERVQARSFQVFAVAAQSFLASSSLAAAAAAVAVVQSSLASSSLAAAAAAAVAVAAERVDLSNTVHFHTKLREPCSQLWSQIHLFGIYRAWKPHSALY